MSSTGTTTLKVELLAHAGVDDGHRAGRRRPLAGVVRLPARRGSAATADSGRCVADRPIRCGGCRGQRLEPLQRQRQVRAALGAGQRVDLVDDDPLHVAQRLACLRGEDEVERLGRGDEDVRRLLAEGPPLLCRGVAGAHAHPHIPRRRAEPVGGQPDAGQGRAQVAVDVVHERLQRRDVEDAQARLGVGRWLLGFRAVETPQEGRQRLAAAGGRADERVLAAPRWPASPAPARRWGRRTSSGTTRAWQVRTRRAGRERRFGRSVARDRHPTIVAYE